MNDTGCEELANKLMGRREHGDEIPTSTRLCRKLIEQLNNGETQLTREEGFGLIKAVLANCLPKGNTHPAIVIGMAEAFKGIVFAALDDFETKVLPTLLVPKEKPAAG